MSHHSLLDQLEHRLERRYGALLEALGFADGALRQRRYSTLAVQVSGAETGSPRLQLKAYWFEQGRRKSRTLRSYGASHAPRDTLEELVHLYRALRHLSHVRHYLQRLRGR